jgi:hypothetical protein
VNTRWMDRLRGLLHGIEWIMFMVTWTILKNHFLEIGLTQNWEMMAFYMLTTVDVFHFMMCEDAHA